MLTTLIQTLVMTNQTPFEWISNHVQLIGWPTLVFIAWQVGRYFTKLTDKITKAIDQIDVMSTNHFPHMQESLANQDRLLANIDKNIARMADKL